MSWNFSAAGRVPDVRQVIAKKLEEIDRTGDSSNPTLVNSLKAAIFAIEKLPDEKVVVVDSSGHVDSYSGGATLTVRTLHP